VRKRGLRSNNVSLFAFQDVMASVIGILFFVVLLMALEIVESSASTLGNLEKDRMLIQSLLNKKDELIKEKQRLKEDMDTTEDKIKVVLSVNDKDLLQEVKGYEYELKDQYRMIEDCQANIRELMTQIKDQKNAYERKKTTHKQLEQKINKLTEGLDGLSSSLSIKYIIDETINLTPWIVEISGNGPYVMSHDGTLAMEFQGDNYESREKKFLSWVIGLNNETDYFVLYIKPSGLKFYDQGLEDKLNKLNFEIGTDLIPEDKKLF
jgi:hypothetical protein